MNIVSESLHEAYSKIKPPQPRRLVRYLIDNPGALTGQIAHDMQIGNVSHATCRAREILEPHGFTIIATLPQPRITNKYGQPCQTHTWRIQAIR